MTGRPSQVRVPLDSPRFPRALGFESHQPPQENFIAINSLELLIDALGQIAGASTPCHFTRASDLLARVARATADVQRGCFWDKFGDESRSSAASNRCISSALCAPSSHLA